ncbi:MAG: hypothetical protein A2103_00930 [Gammaproteobacteria bacterium GWF2_41_13]|nr:MAG: hypothetical protein A2103_00930 [Gammaproteobacteria bacterium GWF2_41_13]
MFKRFFKKNKLKFRVIPESQHRITPDKISEHALSIVRKLQAEGFEAYVVGGSIRDILLGKNPKDFDVATSAHPQEIKAIFRNCRIIGRRFRLAHLYFKSGLIEVATFRAGHENAAENHAKTHDSGLILRDNVYGTFEEDAARRDFTVNALYYDPEESVILDCFDGFKDIRHRRLQVIGDPRARYQEDPVRMLRAIRFLAKLNFKLTAASASAIATCASSLAHISSSRLYDEWLKLFYQGTAEETFFQLKKYRLLEQLFPGFLFSGKTEQFIVAALRDTDERFRQQKPINYAFLWAVFLWVPFFDRFRDLLSEQQLAVPDVFHQAAHEIIHAEKQRVMISRRISDVIFAIWRLQYPLEQCNRRKAKSLLKNPYFRAAHDLLMLRTLLDPSLKSIGKTWWRIRNGNPI